MFSFLLSLVLSPAFAVTTEGVDFPDKITVSKRALLLNGTGVRTATMFKVRVYAAGLYLPKKEHTQDAILALPAPKQLKMVFLRDVGVEDIRKAWGETFSNNCANQCESLKPALEQLRGLMQDMKKGDTLVYTFEDPRLTLSYNGQEKGSIAVKGFSKLILSTWLGQHPPSEALRDGLLGAP